MLPSAAMDGSRLERAAAKLFCVGFDGQSVPAELAALQRRGITGAILFRRNVESPAQVAALNAELEE
ncbi:MAG TPA: beta-N-acetylhexosaminidase, partial [Vulgatibacter sp.]